MSKTREEDNLLGLEKLPGFVMEVKYYIRDIAKLLKHVKPKKGFQILDIIHFLQKQLEDLYLDQLRRELLLLLETKEIRDLPTGSRKIIEASQHIWSGLIYDHDANKLYKRYNPYLDRLILCLSNRQIKYIKNHKYLNFLIKQKEDIEKIEKDIFVDIDSPKGLIKCKNPISILAHEELLDKEYDRTEWYKEVIDNFEEYGQSKLSPIFVSTIGYRNKKQTYILDGHHRRYAVIISKLKSILGDNIDWTLVHNFFKIHNYNPTIQDLQSFVEKQFSVSIQPGIFKDSLYTVYIKYSSTYLKILEHPSHTGSTVFGDLENSKDRKTTLKRLLLENGVLERKSTRFVINYKGYNMPIKDFYYFYLASQKVTKVLKNPEE